MNEQALNDAYKLFASKGYTKSIEEFKVLMSSNENALNDAYKLFSSKGYSKPIDDFKVLIGVSGVKKKEDSEPVGETEGTMASTTEQAPAEDGLSESSFDETIENKDIFLDLGFDEEKSKEFREKLNSTNNPTIKVNSLNELKSLSPESFVIDIPTKEKITEAQKKALRFAMEGPTANLTDAEVKEYKKLYDSAIDAGNVPIVKTPLGNAVNPSDLLEIRRKAKENVLNEEYVAKAKENDEKLINQGIYDNREQIRDRRYETYATHFLNDLDKTEYSLLAQLKQDEEIIKSFEESEFLPNKERAILEAKARRDKTQKNIEDHRIGYIKKNNEYISELRARLAKDPDDEKLKEKLLKAQNRYKAFINPAKEAKKIYTDNPDIQKEDGDTPLEKLQNYYDGLLLQLEDSKLSDNDYVFSMIPYISDLTGADQAVSKYGHIY